MKDEEMAEEYERKLYGEDCKCRSTIGKKEIYHTDVYYAYLDGLHEGQPKWHKYPDEEPDEGTYLVVWKNEKGYKEIFIMNYEEDSEEELHWIDGDCECQDEYICAWCEIPQFKE